MVVDSIPCVSVPESHRPPQSPQPLQTLQQTQQQIYHFFLERVKGYPPADVLAEFESLFFNHSGPIDPATAPALYALLAANDEPEFHNTLKRCCYILINNWDVVREYQAIRILIALFSNPMIRKPTRVKDLRRLRLWLTNFADSQDFQELRQFVASRFARQDPETTWSNQYASYGLIAQYMDSRNPPEQREAARAMSRRLKDQFKQELALYTALSDYSRSRHSRYQNPTELGDEVLQLVKTILMRRGRFSHRNLARIFQAQTQDVTYGSYKTSLIEYLIFGIGEPRFVKLLQQHLGVKLETLYSQHDAQPSDYSLNLRTCNRLIDYLLTEDQEHPSPLFERLLAQNNPLNLTVVLLKIVLISSSTQLYLEARIADLIKHYSRFPRQKCQNIVNFLEVFRVTFALYCDRVEYDLVKPDAVLEAADLMAADLAADDFAADDPLADCRIFSQTPLR